MDLLKVCRLCLIENELNDLKLISSLSSINVTYLEIIKYCIGIEVLDNNSYPKSICSVCEDLLIKFYQFKERIIISNARFDRIVFVKKKNNLEQCSSNIIELKIEKISAIPDIGESVKSEIIENEYLENDCYWNNLSQAQEYSEYEYESQLSDTNQSPKEDSVEDIAKLNSDSYEAENPCSIESKTMKKRKYISRKNFRDLCLVCGKLVYNLLVHSRTHMDPKDRPKKHVCDICNRRFCVKNDLTVHMRKHMGEKRYECEYCGKKFSAWGSRKNHIYSIHTGQHRYTCHICDRKFVIKTSYNAHMLRHTGDKPEKCEICEKAFITKILLKKHQLSHTNEKKYECKLCHKLYKTARSLCEHMKIHNRERNYKCPVCPQAFTQNHVLKAHVIKKHPEYELPPPGTIVSQKALKRQHDELANKKLLIKN